MYAVTSIPEESLTRHTFRKAELGFLGVTVYTRVHTPLRWGAPAKPAVLTFFFFGLRPRRTNC
jgi:hypothetical protein